MFAVNDARCKEQMTSNRLNEGLPQKWPEKRFKVVYFSLDKYQLKKIWVENSVFAIQHIDNRKSVTEVPIPSPPLDQTNSFAYSCSFTFNTSYKNCMIGQGGNAVKMLKNNLLKTFLELIFVQTCR